VKLIIEGHIQYKDMKMELTEMEDTIRAGITALNSTIQKSRRIQCLSAPDEKVRDSMSDFMFNELNRVKTNFALNQKLIQNFNR
jgi:hypothetical protein